ncbi:hypothetical protein V0288_09025 [Pannus brasiliensis CCIBt3594]|uniref:Uncharacterized protein n=1 Tax=Pannus brasiliensis CCIBt3594 TaxID=1427578 RepID=A0AAW9QWA6_9CHRO
MNRTILDPDYKTSGKHQKSLVGSEVRSQESGGGRRSKELLRIKY